LARVLIVGCGCRGRALAEALAADGHLVRGTSRTAAGAAAIESAGVEAALADPDRLGTLLPALDGVGVVCWLMGSAEGSPEEVAALHGPRLQSLLERLVDSPCRGAVYEGGGTVAAALLEQGAAIAAAVEATHRLPVRVVEADPAGHEAWLAGMRSAVAGLLSA
jgi:hypothetical protein